MAPVCLAVCLSVYIVFAVCLMVHLLRQEVLSLLTYDRQTLLEITGFSDQFKYDPLMNFSPEEIPAFLRRPPLHPACQRRWRKSRRRQGKQGGVRVRMETHLRSAHVSDYGINRHFLDVSQVLQSRRIRA